MGVIRPFHDVSHDIKCSYMFIYTPEEFVKEARSMITDTTIEDPTSPARKKNRQEEEIMQSCDEDLPTPEYVPVRGRQRDPDESTSIDEIGHILTSEESNFIELVKEIEKITLIPPKERTEDQKKKLRNMKSKHKKLEKDFQHLDTLLKQKPKTAAEKKAAYRQKQTAETREKVRAADRTRKATEEARAANQARKATHRAGLDDETMEEVRAADRTR